MVWVWVFWALETHVEGTVCSEQIYGMSVVFWALETHVEGTVCSEQIYGMSVSVLSPRKHVESTVCSTEYIFYCKRAILFISSSKICIDPPSPSPPGECAFVAGGGQTRRAERGMHGGGHCFGRREK